MVGILPYSTCAVCLALFPSKEVLLTCLLVDGVQSHDKNTATRITAIAALPAIIATLENDSVALLRGKVGARV